MSMDLFLIRHAKAHEKETGGKDIDRGLTTDGIQNATRTGYFFQQNGIQPDIMISSPAVRARETATLIAEQLKYETNQIHYNDDLYEASVRNLLMAITNLKSTWSQVFIVAHNPSISYIAEYITQSELGSVVPAGFVQIHFPFEDWAQVSEATGDLKKVKDPISYKF